MSDAWLLNRITAFREAFESEGFRDAAEDLKARCEAAPAPWRYMVPDEGYKFDAWVGPIGPI